MGVAEAANGRKDFFISYTSTDRSWAEWIAWHLEEAHYSVIIQAWDFRPGSNFIAEMDKATRLAERTIAVLSPKYFESDYTFVEWAAALRSDPTGKQRSLLPIRVQPCDVEGLLGPVVYIDLVGLPEQDARTRLLEGVRRERRKPHHVPFPLSSAVPAIHEAAQERPAFPAPFPEHWHIPYPRNPIFTGREHVLTQLAAALKTGEATALTQPQAISGLGGIGKTQIAIEYAYQHRQGYQAVLWTLADTREALISGYVQIARQLDLPQKDEQDQELVIEAIKRWFRTQTQWLLIMDNADELPIVREFLPASFRGHILLTTRAQSVGRLAHRIEVETMDRDMGALLLLRRANLIELNATLESASPADIALARVLAEELGGLPLALDQAGAYIEETPSSLSEYQSLYRLHRAELLKARGRLVDDHPEPVATTWSLSFQRVEERNVAAADLLRFCAYLAPDAIPEEIIIGGAEQPGLSIQEIGDNRLALNEAIAALSAYSLIRRNVTEQTISVHRLVQAVLRDSMPVEAQQQWKQRAVLAVNMASPDVQDWEACEQWLPHALVCADWIEQEQMKNLEGARLLNLAGYYLNDRARYREAEPLHRRALAICEEKLGATHPDTAVSLNNLAELHRKQGKYEEAEPLYKRALAIREEKLGATHPDTALSLNNLAALYEDQGKYEEAEPLYRRALAIREEQLGADHPDTAMSLNNLAVLYRDQGKYEEAELLYKRALAIFEGRFGTDHPSTQTVQKNYDYLLQIIDRNDEARKPEDEP